MGWCEKKQGKLPFRESWFPIGPRNALHSVMRYFALITFVLALGACTPAEHQEAHQQADEAKRDAKEALHKAEVETKKVSKELDVELDKARDKARKAMGEPSDKPSR